MRHSYLTSREQVEEGEERQRLHERLLSPKYAVEREAPSLGQYAPDDANLAPQLQLGLGDMRGVWFSLALNQMNEALA